MDFQANYITVLKIDL